MTSGTISVSKRAPQFWRDVLVIIVTIFLSPSIVVKFWGVPCTMFKITKSYKIIQIARTLKRPSLYYVSIFLDFSDHPPFISASIQNWTSAKNPIFWIHPTSHIADVIKEWPLSLHIRIWWIFSLESNHSFNSSIFNQILK